MKSFQLRKARFKMTRILMGLTLVCGLAAPQAMGQSSDAAGYSQALLRNLTSTAQTSRYSAQQFTRNIYNQSVPQFNFSSVNRGLFNSSPTSSALSSKPFSSVSQGPTVTPYLGLSSPYSSTSENYYTQVRPQLDQQNNDRQLRAQMQRRQQLNQMAARGPYDPTGSENMAPTGHAAVFMNYGGYFPMAAQNRR
jgi:hypothetical protein